MSISQLLNIGQQGLSAYQQALAVTSNNISNANNTNYSRQKVVLGSQTPNTGSKGFLGAGVKMEDVTRVKSNLTDSQLRQYYSQNSMATKQSSYLSQVESMLNEPGDSGLSSLVNKFFNSWSELAVTPDSLPLRQNVTQAAQQMTGKLQTIYEGIQQIKPDMKTEADTTVKAINDGLKNIQTLNTQIYQAKIAGSTPNDLMDSRDKAINDLSKLANINVTFDKDNTAIVSMGGIMAVDKSNAMEFHAVEENGHLKVKTSDGSTSMALQGGELGSITQLYNTVLPGLQKKLDDTANKIMLQVNKLHTTGSTLDTPPQTGLNFFDSYKDGVLSINKDIVNDPKKIAASSDGTSGNNTIASQIANLQDQKLSDGFTIGDTYASFVNDVGTSIQASNQTADSTDLVIQQLESQKANYSGVSVDEEMINILKYQRSYDASAKVIKMANDIFQTLLQTVT